MTRDGIGDVEIHIHHDKDTAEGFKAKMSVFCQQLRQEHGLLHDIDGRTVFGFIHGNWALDNSRPGRRMVRRIGRDWTAARVGLLCGLHHAFPAIGYAGEHCEPGLLVYRDARKAEGVRPRN